MHVTIILFYPLFINFLQVGMEQTVYKEGNLRELWKVTMPLMLSYLSFVLMTFVDRLYLAHYSYHAMSEMITATMVVWGFNYGFQILCEMSQVFVAQYNGAKRYKQLGKPVWQMIWAAVAAIPIYFAIAKWGGGLIFGTGEQYALRREYFETLLYFGPVCGLLGAASAFYVGQGKTAVITYLAIIGNLINLVLDPLLIFGIDGYIPSYGVAGAAFATGIGMLIQAVIVFYLFLRKKNAENFGTRNWKIDPSLMKKVFRIGVPPAIFLFLELVGWGAYYGMMSEASPAHIFVAGVCQSIVLLFMFFGIGLEKGVAALAGNLIGANLHDRIPKLVRSALLLLLLYAGVTFIPFIAYPDAILSWFFNHPEALEIGASTPVDIDSIMPLLHFNMLLCYIYLHLETARWAVAGILMAAGDTFFLMATGGVSIWIFLLIPIYYFIVVQGQSVIFASYLLILYALFSYVIVYLRYRQRGWMHASLLEGPEEEPVLG